MSDRRTAERSMNDRHTVDSRLDTAPGSSRRHGCSRGLRQGGAGDPLPPGAPALPADPPAPPQGLSLSRKLRRLPCRRRPRPPARSASAPPRPTRVPLRVRSCCLRSSCGGWGGVVLELHDTQVVTAPGRMRDTMAPWRDGGGNRLFSAHVFGTPFMLNEKGEVLPWDRDGHHLERRLHRLDDEAARGRGVPGRNADHRGRLQGLLGARRKAGRTPSPGGREPHARRNQGLGAAEGRRGREAVGLRVVDDHTLKIEIESPNAAWPLYMATWHIGISKLEQILGML